MRHVVVNVSVDVVTGDLELGALVGPGQRLLDRKGLRHRNPGQFALKVDDGLATLSREGRFQRTGLVQGVGLLGGTVRLVELVDVVDGCPVPIETVGFQAGITLGVDVAGNVPELFGPGQRRFYVGLLSRLVLKARLLVAPRFAAVATAG